MRLLPEQAQERPSEHGEREHGLEGGEHASGTSKARATAKCAAPHGRWQLQVSGLETRLGYLRMKAWPVLWLFAAACDRGHHEAPAPSPPVVAEAPKPS